MAMRASGTYFSIISLRCCKSEMRLLTKYTCPLRDSSKLTASAMISAPKVCISVWMGYRLGGGVWITLRSRAPTSENCSVRGMGVADIVSVSTLVRICRSFSLVATPNFCSSSMISRPKSLNFTVLPMSFCVPIIMSILPSSRSFNKAVVCLVVRARVR